MTCSTANVVQIPLSLPTPIPLTQHVEEDCYSVEMVLRNLPPQPPFVVQWAFPLMILRDDLNPKDLKGAEGEVGENADNLLGKNGAGRTAEEMVPENERTSTDDLLTAPLE